MLEVRRVELQLLFLPVGAKTEQFEKDLGRCNDAGVGESGSAGLAGGFPLWGLSEHVRWRQKKGMERLTFIWLLMPLAIISRALEALWWTSSGERPGVAGGDGGA